MLSWLSWFPWFPPQCLQSSDHSWAYQNLSASTPKPWTDCLKIQHETSSAHHWCVSHGIELKCYFSMGYSPLGLPTEQAICFPNVFLFILSYFSGPNSQPAISETTGPIFTRFSGLVELLQDFIKHLFILWSLMGGCHGNQFHCQICKFCWPNPRSACRHSEMDCRIAILKLNDNNQSTDSGMAPSAYDHIRQAEEQEYHEVKMTMIFCNMIYMLSLPYYCSHKCIKLQNVLVFPISPKTPLKGLWIGIFMRNS